MKVVEGTFNFIDNSLTSGVVINLALALLVRAPMKLMWNMINTLQILTYIPYLNV